MPATGVSAFALSSAYPADETTRSEVAESITLASWSHVAVAVNVYVVSVVLAVVETVTVCTFSAFGAKVPVFQLSGLTSIVASSTAVPPITTL